MKNIFKKIILVAVILSIAIINNSVLSSNSYAEDEKTAKESILEGVKKANGNDKDIEDLDIQNKTAQIISYLLYGVGLLSVIMIIIGGYKYVISSGDAGKVGQAKKTILYALIGLLVSVLAFSIVNFVVNRIVDDPSASSSSKSSGNAPTAPIEKSKLEEK